MIRDRSSTMVLTERPSCDKCNTLIRRVYEHRSPEEPLRSCTPNSSSQNRETQVRTKTDPLPQLWLVELELKLLSSSLERAVSSKVTGTFLSTFWNKTLNRNCLINFNSWEGLSFYQRLISLRVVHSFLSQGTLRSTGSEITAYATNTQHNVWHTQLHTHVFKNDLVCFRGPDLLQIRTHTLINPHNTQKV